ncbi:MAG: hypothetical protein EPN74_13555 [Rhodanobacter sp.]|nr:MAG: hypothetical protein EPN74_13555 [Rhodanobacter sp.]
MDTQSLHALPVVLALEPVSGQALPQLSLSRDEAAVLAEHIARDLQALIPQVVETRLALAGAWFDQVELLRPGFPVWATLEELARRVPRGQTDHVVAFGSHQGQMPAPALQPSTEFSDGPMRLLPLSLLAPVELATELSEQLELQLVGRGEAGALTADWLMRTLGVRLEHVRYLSRNDLLALTCVQYEHVNLAALWSLLETALLTPQRDESVVSARGLTLHYAHGAARVQSPTQWLDAQQSLHALSETDDDGGRRHALAGILFELRQYASLLEAHRLPLQLQAAAGQTVHAGPGYLAEVLAAAAPEGGPPSLFAHEAPGLGIVAVTVAQYGADGHASALAHGYPLQAQALPGLLDMFAERYGTRPELQVLGRIVLDHHGGLGVPVATLH